MTPEASPARWCADAALALAAASDRAAGLAMRIAEDWLDDRGREWAERVALLQRELGRSAEEAAELGERLARPDPGAVALPPVPVRGRGPRLGGTTGTRVDDDNGMRIAELPPG